VADADGANERQLTDVDATVTSWSPDGKYLLYSNSGNVMMHAVTGNEPAVEVGSPNGDSRLGMFSPDGRFIAYDSRESGRFETYVRAIPPATQRVKVSINGGFAPRWRRDGKEMYFLNLESAVMAVDVSSGDSFTAGVPRELFRTDGRDITLIYDLNADGTRFLLPARAAGNVDSPITVVLNWWVELESRLGSAER
jgi:Tol biopolymer transport system component